MNHIKYLVLVCILCGPQLGFAVEEVKHKFADKEQIKFSPETMVAFDRTGKFTTRRTLADGSSITQFNGSMRSVTVARMGPDGKIETFCTSDAEAARSWMAGEFDVDHAATKIVPVSVK
jgi:hypothetical protein